MALPIEQLTSGMIRSAVESILSDPGYREAAARMQVEICAARGLERAAELIEKSMERFATSHRALTHRR